MAIGSGKGGVGKSTLTMQLARSLTWDGARVAILDADLNGPSQGRLGGLQDAPLIPGPEGLVVPRTADGIGVLSVGSMLPEGEALAFDSVSEGGSHHWRTTREFAAMASLLAGVHWGDLDFLLVDLPPGAERTRQHAEFFGEALAMVLVTIPSALSRGVVARSLAALEGSSNRILGYVENMSGYFCRDCDEVKPLFVSDDEVALNVPRLGSVPFDPRLAAACDRGTPPDVPAANPTLQATGEIAASIRRQMENEA